MRALFSALLEWGWRLRQGNRDWPGWRVWRSPESWWLARPVEPVTVAVNVQWGPAGTRQAYQCSEVPAGVAEVYHTERIMWLAAFSPSVVFLAWR